MGNLFSIFKNQAKIDRRAHAKAAELEMEMDIPDESCEFEDAPFKLDTDTKRSQNYLHQNYQSSGGAKFLRLRSQLNEMVLARFR